MRSAIIVGDACSGKSSVLRLLAEKGFRVVLEEGLPLIPAEIEREKFLSNIWFIDYYYQREKDVATPTIFEYALWFQFPFTVAQRRAGKITPGEEAMLISHLAKLGSTRPLSPETIVFHFTLPNSEIISRLALKKQSKPADHTKYLDILREETQRYFSTKTKYYTIDTSGKPPHEVAQQVATILEKEDFGKNL